MSAFSYHLFKFLYSRSTSRPNFSRLKMIEWLQSRNNSSTQKLPLPIPTIRTYGIAPTYLKTLFISLTTSYISLTLDLNVQPVLNIQFRPSFCIAHTSTFTHTQHASFVLNEHSDLIFLLHNFGKNFFSVSYKIKKQLGKKPKS